MQCICANNQVLFIYPDNYTITQDETGATLVEDTAGNTTVINFVLDAQIIRGVNIPADCPIYLLEYNNGAPIAPGYAALVANLINNSLLKLSEICSAMLMAELQISTVVTGNTLYFAYTPDWQSIINGAMIAAQENPGMTFVWEDNRNFDFNLSSAQIIAMWNIGMAYIQSCMANNKALKDALKACTTVSGIAAINLNSGWPSVVH